MEISKKITIEWSVYLALFYGFYLIRGLAYLKRGKKTLHLHDLFAFLTIILFTLYATFIILAAHHGLGQHAFYLSPPELAKATFLELIGQTFCLLGIACMKLTVFALQLTLLESNPSTRLLNPLDQFRERNFNLLARLVIIFLVVFLCLFVAITDFLRCSPAESVWNSNTSLTCWMSANSYTILSTSLSVLSALADLILAILPSLKILKLQMERERFQKYSLCATILFGGCLTAIAGALRTWKLLGLSKRNDYTFGTVDLNRWSAIESVVSFFAYCLFLSTGMLHSVYRSISRLLSNLYGLFLSKSYPLPVIGTELRITVYDDLGDNESQDRILTQHPAIGDKELGKQEVFSL